MIARMTDLPCMRTRRSRKAHTAMDKFERCMAKCQEHAENDEAELATCFTQRREEFAADTTSSAEAETEDQVDDEKEKQATKKRSDTPARRPRRGCRAGSAPLPPRACSGTP